MIQWHMQQAMSLVDQIHFPKDPPAEKIRMREIPQVAFPMWLETLSRARRPTRRWLWRGRPWNRQNFS